jgi:membrane-bound lytic murein transglycosylase A
MKNSFVLTALALTATACAAAHSSSMQGSSLSSAPFITQTVEVQSDHLSFHDDLDFKLLDTAIQRQITAYDSGVSLAGRVQFGSTIFSKTVLRDSLVLFQEIARTTKDCIEIEKKERSHCFDRFNTEIKSRFRIFRPKQEQSRYTAYYSPDFDGALVPTEKYKLPLYSAPSDPVLANSSSEQIIFENILSNKGLECAYIDADLFQLYSLQIEGGGRIHLHDNSGNVITKHISYDGKNSLPLRFFSKLMVQNGYLAQGDTSYDHQHQYFVDHPEIQRTLFSQNPSYVYFKLTDEEPLGIDSIPLTENRSLAFDPKYFPVSGVLSLIQVNVGGRIITRFMLGQDVGGAIKGPARADLYFGYGEEARVAAESLASYGSQYFLIKK